MSPLRGLRNSKLVCSALAAVGCSVGLACCVGDDPSTTGSPDNDASTSDGSVTGDGATNDANIPPASGFNLVITPKHVTVDPGDAPITIGLTVVRAPSFTDDISFTLGSVIGFTASPAADTGTGSTANTSSFTLTVGAPGLGDGSMTITAQNPSKSFVQNGTLGIRVGSLLNISDGGLSVPDYATALNVKLWGAGGGGSTAAGNPAGFGGGGGFAGGTIPVTGGDFLVFQTGTGGGGGLTPDGSGGYGGGGGGFSAIRTSTGVYLMIAGGGSGVGGGTGSEAGGSGYAGGGFNGQSGKAGIDGHGGTQTGGGAAPTVSGGQVGTKFQGGSFGTAVVDGGTPGGGAGGQLAGGGGGGWYGGSSGTNTLSVAGGGGGGGSGYSITDAGLLNGADKTQANAADPDNSGAGAGGAADGGIGAPGRIIVRLSKP